MKSITCNTFHIFILYIAIMFYLINKPKWMSSFQVIRELRKKLGIKKMWHIWTLDPLASGLMLIATEQSTKLISFINSEKKWYIFKTHIDGKTASLDLEQPIEMVDITNVQIPTKEFLEKSLLQITEQIPPKFSAIHINGKRAYNLARKDKDFEIPKRKITVHFAKILEQNKKDITTEIVISAWWYIRSFAPIIANWCGTDGWYVSLLCRHQLFFGNNILTMNRWQDLENFNKNIHIPESIILPDFEHIFIESDDSLLADIKNGIPPNRESFLQKFPQLKNIKKDSFFILITFWKKYSSLLQINWTSISIVKNDVKSF